MKMYRLAACDVRDSQSPQDTIVAIGQVTVASGAGTVTTPFKEGTKVAYSVLYEATVGANGALSFDTATNTTAGIMVLGKNQARQNDMSTWE